jgi:hypothetical protein
VLYALNAVGGPEHRIVLIALHAVIVEVWG